jgi:hypothetical protein
MRARRHIALALSFFLLSGGCHQRSSPEPDPVPVDNVEGTLRLRDGAVFPPGATLRVIVWWYETPLAERVISPTDAWPIKFRIPLKEWPYGKGIPSRVAVHAKAELNGRTVMISEYASQGLGDQPVDLVLHPAME